MARPSQPLPPRSTYLPDAPPVQGGHVPGLSDELIDSARHRVQPVAHPNQQVTILGEPALTPTSLAALITAVNEISVNDPNLAKDRLAVMKLALAKAEALLK